MNKLQNNFTTIEQSNRLLELGIPVDSADCYNVVTHIGKIPDGKTYKDVYPMSVWRKKNGSHIEMYPCWSVGRLIEIYEICFGGYFGYRYFRHTLMEDVLLKIEEQIDSINFSKLEE